MSLPARLVGDALFPLHERLMGRPTFAFLEELERSQWRSRGEIEAQQARRLTALLRTAHAHSPWFARRMDEVGFDPHGRELALSDLQELPTMDKADASAHREELVWRGAPGGVFPYNTGGSSGVPLSFYFGRARQASDAAGRMRARRWWGVDVGEREVYLWGAPVELNKTDIVKVVRDRLLNQLVLNAFNMSEAAMDGYLDAIRSYRPACIYGYASSIALLAAHAQDRGVRMRLPTLKVVCTTGEPLFEHQRELIGSIFGVPVANEYGSRDIGFTAHETPEGQMLLISESIVLEVLDPQGLPVAAGESGEAVMTGLCSEAQPFIRYRTGDMVRLSTDPCRAGRGLHVISQVAGRQTDFIVRSDGTIMHALAVIYVLRAIEGIRQFKCVQHVPNAVEVLIVPEAGWSAAQVARIAAGLRARLGADLRVDCLVCDSIPPEASGKHRYVVSHVELSPGLRVASGVVS